MMHCRHRFKVSAILENACSVREWALLSTHLMRGREHTVSAEGMFAVRTLLRYLPGWTGQPRLEDKCGTVWTDEAVDCWDGMLDLGLLQGLRAEKDTMHFMSAIR